MLNHQIISTNFQPAQIDDPIATALDLMQENDWSHLPICDAGKYLGLLPIEVAEHISAKETIRDIAFRLMPVSVRSKDHVFKAASLFAFYPTLSFVPVIDEEGAFLGAVSKEDIFTIAGSLLGLKDNGALVVLDMDPRSFSLGELTKLVETNDAHITQLYTSPGDNGRLVVTFRVSTQEVSDIVATLQRYDYSVVYFEGEELYENQLRQNYNLLMNFLEM